MTEIPDEIMAKAREVALQLNGGFFHADVNVIAAALLSERTASEAALKEARAKLFPYADATEISGMSWNGFYLIGDEKSINELRRLENRSSQIEIFKAAFDEKVATLEAENARLTKKLHDFDVFIAAAIAGLEQPSAEPDPTVGALLDYVSKCKRQDETIRELMDENARLTRERDANAKLDWTGTLCDRLNSMAREHGLEQCSDGQTGAALADRIHGLLGTYRAEKNALPALPPGARYGVIMPVVDAPPLRIELDE